MSAKQLLASLTIGLSVWLSGCAKGEPPAPRPILECEDPKIVQEVQNILANTQGFRIEDMTPDMRMVEDLGIDGASRIKIRYDLQQNFAIKIHEDEIKQARTVSELAAFVEKKRAAKK